MQAARWTTHTVFSSLAAAAPAAPHLLDSILNNEWSVLVMCILCLIKKVQFVIHKKSRLLSDEKEYILLVILS